MGALPIQDQVFPGGSPSPRSDTRFLFPYNTCRPVDQSDIGAEYVAESFCLSSLVAGTDFPPQKQQ